MLLLWSAASFKTHFCKTCRCFDYHTSVVAGQPVEQTGRLQISRFQNSAARLVLKKRDRDLIAPLLNELHWLPVQFLCEYKVAACVPSLRQNTAVLLLIAALHVSNKTISHIKQNYIKYHAPCGPQARSFWKFLYVICNFCVSALSVSSFHLSGILCLLVYKISPFWM